MTSINNITYKRLALPESCSLAADLPNDYPESRQWLRAVLVLIESAKSRGDIAGLFAMKIVCQKIGTLEPLLRAYCDALAERVDDPEERYAQCSHERFDKLQKELHAAAYGNFYEALHVLEGDLRLLANGQYPTRNYQTLKTSYFTTDQLRMWRNLSEPLSLHFELNPGPDDIVCLPDYITAANNALTSLREHQQAQYGLLVPVLTATYIDESAGQVLVRLAWQQDQVIVTTDAPFKNDAIDWFISTHPIYTRDDFTPSVFPEQFGSYRLSEAAHDNLFAYEMPPNK